MKSIKSLDFFQKITVDNIDKPTLIGSFISISAIFLIIYLIIEEFCNFLTPNIRKEPIIYQDSENSNQIKANFSIKLLNTPCAIVSVDREDLIGVHNMDIKENIIKMRLDSSDNKILGSYVPYKTELLEKSLIEKESCYIKGFLQINKAPGDIHISFHNFREVWEYFRNNKASLFNTLTVNHEILSMNFGEKEQNKKILERFGDKHLDINSNTFPTFSEEINSNKFYNFDYYIKLIPHLYNDEINGDQFLAYQYSLSFKSKLIESEEEMPIIMINYDLSPITMKITLQRKSFTRFLIHICAIVGGVFVIFSIINRILIMLLEDCCRDTNSSSNSSSSDNNSKLT